MEGSSVKLGDFVLLDDLFKLRAADPVQVPLIGIPNPQASANDFELLTGKDINDFVNRAAKYYEESDLRVVSLSPPCLKHFLLEVILLKELYADCRCHRTLGS